MERSVALENINAHVDSYTEKHNVKKESIAEAIGIGRTTFYTKLRGDSNFDIFEAMHMANLFGCTIDDLLDTKPTP